MDEVKQAQGLMSIQDSVKVYRKAAVELLAEMKQKERSLQLKSIEVDKEKKLVRKIYN